MDAASLLNYIDASFNQITQMNKTVTNFYNKENDSQYYKKYEREHAPRLDFAVKHFKLDEIKNQKVADFGCGYGFLLKRLDDSNDKTGIDGIDSIQKLCNFRYAKMDLDQIYGIFHHEFDISFCFETLEHLAAPYNALCNIKWFTKENAPIYISIPDEETWHNVIYPGLMFPHTNFEEFLLQMALPIEEHVRFNGDWPARIWKCRNAPWGEKKLKYPKEEEKFRDITPLECTNI